MAAKSASIAGVSLGIGQLPASASLMQAGRPYAVTSMDLAAQRAFVAGAIAHSLKQSRRVVWLAGEAPEAVLRILGAEAHSVNVARELETSRLTVLKQNTDAQAQLAQHGAVRVIDEIDEFCDPHGALVIAAPADGLLDTADHRAANRQARTYARWFRERNATGVFLFNGRAAMQRLRDGLQALDGWFAGLAHLRSDGRRLYWGVEHWRAPEGSSMQRSFGLALSRNDVLLVADGAEVAAPEQKILAAPDHDIVYATAGSVAGARAFPLNWHIFQTPAELLSLAPGAVAATFILDLDRLRGIEPMAQLIHQMRRQGGNGVKIVVRERSARLRYNHEMLLMRLGANAVIDASLSFSRFLAVIDSLRDQVFTRELPGSFDTALRSAMPPAASGYLRPQDYCAAVREAVERGAAIGVHSALLRLMIHPQLSHLEVLRKIRLKRPGDLFSADDRSVYVFLFACRQADIDSTLETVVMAPLDELFEGQTRWIDDDVLVNAIDNLERRLRHIAAADFGPLLDHGPAPAEAVAAEPVADAVAPVAITALPPMDTAPIAAQPARKVERAALQLRAAP